VDMGHNYLVGGKGMKWGRRREFRFLL